MKKNNTIIIIVICLVLLLGMIWFLKEDNKEPDIITDSDEWDGEYTECCWCEDSASAGLNVICSSLQKNDCDLNKGEVPVSQYDTLSCGGGNQHGRILYN